MSGVLQKDGYYASYNVPYFNNVQEMTGLPQLIQQYGSWFSYDECPRAKIFRRDQGKVRTMEDMEKLMRYDNFKHDPLSTQMDTCEYLKMTNCTPPYTSENSISVRGDLNPADGVWGLPEFAMRNHAGIDAKICSASMFDPARLTARIISGPTYDQQPVFVFSQSPYANYSHIGIPDVWKFPWMTISWE